MAPIDAAWYGGQDPDRRLGSRVFDLSLFSSLEFDPFEKTELHFLDQATQIYKRRRDGQSATLHQKELERFVIELSWKSSKIEGNTYSLLDTEKLICDGVFAPGHPKDEAYMILNHKEAFKFIYDHRDLFKTVSPATIEEVHKMVVKDLNVDIGVRNQPVGVTGSVYVPLDNAFQIREALEQLCLAVNRMPHGYAKALLTVLGISYIQPFEDGNKRTERLMANALLLAEDLAPLSYRSVEESAYREAALVFYELRSLFPFKKIFIEQYDFAARNYLI